jgi:CheY-like chemotaxis protein
VEFQQLDASTAKKYQGTGLGLALTKRIVEAQGGRVGAESVPGKGSVFFAVLPRVGGAIRREPERPAAVARPGAPTLLVIEDDPKDRAWLVATLAQAGYAVEMAETGAEAIALARERSFDAITLDLLLPDVSGREVLKALRAQGPNRTTPIIVVTVMADKGIASGFHVHDILVKPVAREDLLASLGSVGALADGTRQILVVDDDPAALKLAEVALTEAGYRARCCSSGETGLEAVREEAPVAVVLDLLMPEMDGLEFLRRFREDPGTRRTPVIIWTVKDLTLDEQVRLMGSVQAVVEKGQGTAALLEEVRVHVPLPVEADREENGV